MHNELKKGSWALTLVLVACAVSCGGGNDSAGGTSTGAGGVNGAGASGAGGSAAGGSNAGAAGSAVAGAGGSSGSSGSSGGGGTAAGAAGSATAGGGGTGGVTGDHFSYTRVMNGTMETKTCVPGSDQFAKDYLAVFGGGDSRTVSCPGPVSKQVDGGCDLTFPKYSTLPASFSFTSAMPSAYELTCTGPGGTPIFGTAFGKNPSYTVSGTKSGNKLTLTIKGTWSGGGGVDADGTLDAEAVVTVP